MAYCTEIALTMVDFYIDRSDVVAPVDPLISQISPKHFNAYCSENYKKIFKRIRRKSIFLILCLWECHQEHRSMCQTGPDGISVDENLPMKSKRITDRYNVAIGGIIPNYCNALAINRII